MGGHASITSLPAQEACEGYLCMTWWLCLNMVGRNTSVPGKAVPRTGYSEVGKLLLRMRVQMSLASLSY